MFPGGLMMSIFGRRVIPALLSLVLFFTSAAPVLAGLKPTRSASGMSCCRKGAHACCKRSEHSSGPKWRSGPECKDKCSPQTAAFVHAQNGLSAVSFGVSLPLATGGRLGNVPTAPVRIHQEASLGHRPPPHA